MCVEWDQFCKINRAPSRLKLARLDPSAMMPEKRAQMGLKWLEAPAANMILRGKPGRGKTYFMWGLLHGLSQRLPLYDYRVCSSVELDEQMLAELDKFKTCSHIIKPLLDVRYLFIDDLGVERTSERVEREYGHLIDHRLMYDRITVITTNLSSEDIALRYGPRTKSRLHEYAWIEFGGPDLREMTRKDLEV